jgi:hypothetical protein
MIGLVIALVFVSRHRGLTRGLRPSKSPQASWRKAA